jgi:hypothetical protein
MGVTLLKLILELAVILAAVRIMRPIITTSLPGWVSQLGVSQVWNIIEGKNQGVSVLIFDGISEGVRSHPCTFIGCQTEQSPFPMTTSAEPVVQMRGWWVFGGVKFFGFFHWFMGTRRLDRHLDHLRG